MGILKGLIDINKVQYTPESSGAYNAPPYGTIPNLLKGIEPYNGAYLLPGGDTQSYTGQYWGFTFPKARKVKAFSLFMLSDSAYFPGNFVMYVSRNGVDIYNYTFPTTYGAEKTFYIPTPVLGDKYRFYNINSYVKWWYVANIKVWVEDVGKKVNRAPLLVTPSIQQSLGVR